MIKYQDDENVLLREGKMTKPFTNSIDFITPKIAADSTIVLQWAKEYISQPHPDLGREGPICPFVPPSIKKDLFYVTLHYEVDGSSLDILKYIILSYSDMFLSYFPTNEPDKIYKTIIAVFPNISDEKSPILDEMHKEIKDDFVKKGMMIGQFHKNCPELAARNPLFKISVSPLPLVAMRYMSIHDILFLNNRKDWFLEYDKRFGWKYNESKVTEKKYVELYNDAKEHYLT